MLPMCWKYKIARLLVVILLLQAFPFYGAVEQQVEAALSEETQSKADQAIIGKGAEVQISSYQESIGDYIWEKKEFNLDPPPARMKAAMAFDETARNVVLFGGDGASALLNDTWIWDGTEQTWQEQHTGPTIPAARKGASLAFDPVSKMLLLFGGEGVGGVLYNEVWQWDRLQASWVELSVLSQSPSPRAGAQLASDGEHLILFGGYDYVGSQIRGLGDTWLWNGTGWEALTPEDSPPPTYDGQMVFDGKSAVLFGGNMGTITTTYESSNPSSGATATLTHDEASSLRWEWNAADNTWISHSGPETYGRWGHAAAYDANAQRAVFFSGIQDYVHTFTLALMLDQHLPSDEFPALNRGSLAYGLKADRWETKQHNGTESIYLSDEGYEGTIQTATDRWFPFPLSYASMAFDGKNFVLFGGHRHEIDVRAKIENAPRIDFWPAAKMNETWTYGYTPPTAPGVEMEEAEHSIIVIPDPQRINDRVNVITSVYDDGGADIVKRGIVYRPYSESGTGDWVDAPYSDISGTTIGTFTVELTGLIWQQEYEVRGYAENAIGVNYTPIRRFTMKDDGNMLPPEVKVFRVGASALHVKDKKRLVAVGEGITNLLRKPLGQIDYYLTPASDPGSVKYPLKWNIRNSTQLELTWEDELPHGTYDVVLDHAFYTPYVFEDGLIVTNLSFYKPRNFGTVTVASTSGENEINSLVVQGPFVETPENPSVYELEILNEEEEIVTFNGTLLYKGKRLVIDKSASSGKAIITGEGRLYVNAGNNLAESVSYTLHEGPFQFDSDQFRLELAGTDTIDYLNMAFPAKLTALDFTRDGLRLGGDLEIGFQAGNQKIADWAEMDSMLYRNNRFELSGTYGISKPLAMEPFQIKDAKFWLDSRIPYVGLQATGGLNGTAISFNLNMLMKYGRLDAVSFDLFEKHKLASTGLQVNYLYGSAKDLAVKTTLPQTFQVKGSIQDVIVPQTKHPDIAYTFNLLGSDTIDLSLNPYGFTSGGIVYYYWLPLQNSAVQGVVDPKKAAIKGFSKSGFAAQGTLNAFDMIKGTIQMIHLNGDTLSGVVKGTVHVPKGIPRLGGATVRNVNLAVRTDSIIGTFKHNGIGARVSYTFSNNTMLFEVEAEPPKKSWWQKTLSFMDSVSDFFDKLEPWVDIFEEIFLYKTGPQQMVQIASESSLARVYDLKPMNVIFHPEGAVDTDHTARIAIGKLTALETTPSMEIALVDAGKQPVFRFTEEEAYHALVIMQGDQRTAALQPVQASSTVTVSDETTTSVDTYYSATQDRTYLRTALEPGAWELTASIDSQPVIAKLLYGGTDVELSELAETWQATPERAVTAVEIPTSGVYVLEVEQTSNEVIVYKPDGRPYVIQTASDQPDWNAYRDEAGRLHIRIQAVESGTWLIHAGEAPAADLHSIAPQYGIAEITQWVQHDEYPLALPLRATPDSQAIVEIYGATANTKIYKPDGELYVLQSNPNLPAMNARMDEGEQKLTVLLHGVDQEGIWEVSSDAFVDVIAYESTRKFKTVKALFAEGRHSRYVEFPDAGSYMLTVIGGSTDTVLIDPSGKPYVLDFSDPDGNAYLQPASDRIPADLSSEDLDTPHMDRSQMIADGRDALYISVIDAAAGKWLLQNEGSFDLEIQKLLPLPEVAATVETIANNHIQLDWSMKHAQPGGEVSLVLTDQPDSFAGESLATGLAPAGSQSMALPSDLLPGTYYLAIIYTSVDGVPTFATAEGTVTVSAPYALDQPQQPKVAANGNGEFHLTFPAVDGDVSFYRIWVGGGEDGLALTPVLDTIPQAGNLQQVVLAGLPVGHSYKLAISAVGQQNGRYVLSPLSNELAAELPVPQPAKLDVTMNAGGKPVAERSFPAYDGEEEQLLLTSAEQAWLQVKPDQASLIALSINGRPLASQQVAKGETHAFALHELLQAVPLQERDYALLLEAVNERGDRSLTYRKLIVDRTGPMLFVSGGNDLQGEPIALNGTVTSDTKLYLVGQTDVGAKLDIDGVRVPLDDDGRFVYYLPLHWGIDGQKQIVLTATDEIGNRTEHGFEVLLDAPGTLSQYPQHLAALTTGKARMSSAYSFHQLSYEADASDAAVRVYAVAFDSNATVTINGTALTDSGYVEVEVPDNGVSVPIIVHTGSGSSQTYTLKLNGRGSDAAVLSGLSLYDASLDQARPLSIPTFTGMEDRLELYVAHEIEQVSLLPQALLSGSKLMLNGKPIASGKLSSAQALQVGENHFDLEVVSPDRTHSRTYVLDIWREASEVALLAQLQVNSEGRELLTDFVPNQRHYKMTAAYTANRLSITPVVEQMNATVTIDGQPVVEGNAISVPFEAESQTHRVEVTAQNGEQTSYTISVLRQQRTPDPAPLLSELDSEAVLQQVFDPYQLRYDTLSPTMVGKSKVTAIAENDQALVTVAGVTRRGGGQFEVPLSMGDNTVLVQVESPDHAGSQTYSLQIKRIAQQPLLLQTRQASISGGDGTWSEQVQITRYRTESGRWIDRVTLEPHKAREIIQQAQKNGDTTVRIYLADDVVQPADEWMISFIYESIRQVSEAGISLQVILPYGKLLVSDELLTGLVGQSKGLYYHVVPVRDQAERKAVEDRLQGAELLKPEPGEAGIAVIGTPVKIVSNYSGFETELELPLYDWSANSEAWRVLLSRLGVYIEHSDGDTVLESGTIRYDDAGKPNGLAVTIDKFSTFALIQQQGAMVMQTLDPYVSGFADGTFRPAQTITRAELAALLHRLYQTASDAELEPEIVDSGFPDVATDHWAGESIASMQRFGLMLGDRNGAFRPQDAVTRAELASMAARLLTDEQGQAHTDYPDIAAHWASEAINRVTQAGIMTGYADGSFRPNGKLTRAEAVRVLNGLFGRPGYEASTASWPDVPQTHWAYGDVESASSAIWIWSDGRVELVQD